MADPYFGLGQVFGGNPYAQQHQLQQYMQMAQYGAGVATMQTPMPIESLPNKLLLLVEEELS